MPPARLAIDPLWQCLCPQWATAIVAPARYSLNRPRHPGPRCLRQPAPARRQRYFSSQREEVDSGDVGENGSASGGQINHVNRVVNPRAEASPRREHALSLHRKYRQEAQDLKEESTPFLYTRLRSLAAGGKTRACRELVETLVRERRERPNVQLYNALVLSNTSHDQGAAWRVSEYLEEMREAGLQLDAGTCHAALKVLAVHPDHLLRTDILEYMKMRWFHLSEEGAHDVAAGLLREGLFEQALDRMDNMRKEGVSVQAWLLDIAVYMLCAANEVEEAYRIMRLRYDAGELNLSKTLWHTLLDTSSVNRHHAATALIWNSQVNVGYLNPSSGICLAVLTTASQAGDAVLATDVFTHLAKCGTPFQRIHYHLLLECYLSHSPPDLKRALSILPIMYAERLEPSPTETRSLYNLLRGNSALVNEALSVLHALHAQGRRVPIAALNLLIECFVEQRNLPEALRIYKLLHTFAAPERAGAAKKTFTNIETFNLLLRGCRLSAPPDEALASFLVSELLALNVKPTALTYDRLILVFVEAGAHALKTSSTDLEDLEAQGQRERGLQLLDWAFRHFVDMQAVSSAPTDNPSFPPSPLGWLPRLGTLERLATQLAQVSDARCWDVLQVGVDHGAMGGVEGWEAKGRWVRRNVEGAWGRGTAAASGNEEGVARSDEAEVEVVNAAAVG